MLTSLLKYPKMQNRSPVEPMQSGGIMAEKILVVDDEVSLQETLAYNLKKEGYLVEVAGMG